MAVNSLISSPDHDLSNSIQDYDTAGFSAGAGAARAVTVMDDCVADERPTRQILAAAAAALAEPTADVPPAAGPGAGSADAGGAGGVGAADSTHTRAMFSLLWQVRLQRLLGTAEGRRALLRATFSAAAVLLCCYQDATLLSQFFSDKTDLLRDFLYLLRTGPGSVDYRRGAAPLALRLLAVQCITSVISSRDSMNASVLGVRFSWLQHDLGVNRGQYMGLLPCVLRSLTSFLVSDADGRPTERVGGTGALKATEGGLLGAAGAAGAAGATVAMPVAMPVAAALTDEEREEFLVWAESVLGLLLALISLTSALPALTDNGIVSSIATVLAHKPARHEGSDRAQPSLAYTVGRETTSRTSLDSLIVLILDTAITNHPAAFTVFKDQGGAEQALMRTLDELALMSDPVTVVGEADSNSSSSSDSSSSGSSSSSSSSSSSGSSSSGSGGGDGAMAVDDGGDRRGGDGDGSSSGNGLNVTSAEALTAASEGARWRVRKVAPAHAVLLNQVRLWPAWKCPRLPCVALIQARQSFSSLFHQVRSLPRLEALSDVYPGTLTSFSTSTPTPPTGHLPHPPPHSTQPPLPLGLSLTHVHVHAHQLVNLNISWVQDSMQVRPSGPQSIPTLSLPCPCLVYI